MSVRHLLENGAIVYANLLHFNSYDTELAVDDFISKYQRVGTQGKSGLPANYKEHVHFEIAGQQYSDWVGDASACPGDGCPIRTTTRTTAYDIGNLHAYFPVASTAQAVRTPLGGHVWYDPTDFGTHRELLPCVSRKAGARCLRYDVYAVANTAIYAYAPAKGTFVNGVAIRSVNGTSRRGASSAAASTVVASKTGQVTNGLEGSKSDYPAGEYQFYCTVNGATPDADRVGYPLHVRFVERDDTVIVDNDQLNDAQEKFVYESQLPAMGDPHWTVPGYYYSADLVAGRTSAVADWRPGHGIYKVSVHVPALRTAEARMANNVRYQIHASAPKQNEAPLYVLTSPVSHASQAGEWVELTGADGTELFGWDDSGGVRLEISNAAGHENFDITSDRYAAFDALMFERYGEFVWAASSVGRTVQFVFNVKPAHENVASIAIEFGDGTTEQLHDGILEGKLTHVYAADAGSSQTASLVVAYSNGYRFRTSKRVRFVSDGAVVDGEGDDNTFDTAQAIAPNTEIHNASIGGITKPDKDDYYRFSLETVGRLSIGLQAEKTLMVSLIRGGDRKPIMNAQMRSETKTVGLQRGEYFLRVNYNLRTSSYSAKLRFDAVETDDDPFNDKDTAPPFLQLNSLTRGNVGFYGDGKQSTVRDFVDYYALQIESTGRLRLVVDSDETVDLTLTGVPAGTSVFALSKAKQGSGDVLVRPGEYRVKVTPARSSQSQAVYGISVTLTGGPAYDALPSPDEKGYYQEGAEKCPYWRVINYTSLRCMKAPGEQSAVAANVKKGEVLTSLETLTHCNKGYPWLRVKTAKGKDCYVKAHENYISPITEAELAAQP